MKWVALAILLFVVVYTLITLGFRKPGQPYRPYQEARERATVERLESAGFKRALAISEQPADAKRSAARLTRDPANVRPVFGGLSSELAEALVDKPQLPLEFSMVAASGTAKAAEEYAVQFTCTLPDKTALFAETFLYFKEGEIALVANFEPIGNELLARNRACTVLVKIPPGTFKPGAYRVTLVGARGSQQWPLQVH